jgi:hypothetical protein
MKSKLLLMLSVICITASLVLAFVVPVVADEVEDDEGPHGAEIMKWNVPNQNLEVGDWVTAHIRVKSIDQNGCTLRIELIEDTIAHLAAPATESGNILDDSGAVTLSAGAYQDPATYFVYLDLGEYVEVTYAYQVLDGDAVDGTTSKLKDEAHAKGWDPENEGYFHMTYPGKVIVSPLPELAAGILFGSGVLAMGGFIFIKRKESAAKN